MQIKKGIETKRKELSIIAELEKGSRVKERKARNIEKKHKIQRNQSLTEIKETIKQKMQENAQRVRRFEKRSKFDRQNKIFKEDAKKLYRQRGKKSTEVNEPTEIQEVEPTMATYHGVKIRKIKEQTEGLTYLLPKTEETKNPKNYRRITCLPTLYKILTSVLTKEAMHLLKRMSYCQLNIKDVREEVTDVKTSC